jgi:hypothetical protein
MIIRVENCVHGSRWNFRLTMPNGNRECIPHEEGENWNRKFASEALDLLESVYGCVRSNIRFNVC